MSESDERDKEIFRAAMREVKRLQPGPHKPELPKPPAQARFTRSDQREVLRESLLPPPDTAKP